MSLRREALRVLVETDPNEKSRLARALDPDMSPGSLEKIAQPRGIPGRPDKPALVAHTQLKSRSITTTEGRAALLHALAHIELNAIDLAVDAVWRFAWMPKLFYRQWTVVAKEEALHFQLLRDHLRLMGFDYGSFPAHNALWEMAEKTSGDLLARIALVPRTLEARGLDASPPIKAKLVAAGDHKAGEILDVILADEIGHVAIGNHWYRVLCEERGLDPIATYRELAEKYGAPRPRGPFNLEARRAAGFEEDELAILMGDRPSS
jgi:uncharacterized ferritin-like protein (DUF455 family)